MNRWGAAVAALVMGWAAPAAAQVVPSPLIAPVVFHWPQLQTAYPTLEGGAVGDASVRFWRRQTKDLESAGFNGQLFQISFHDEWSQRNHLEALRQIRAERLAAGQPPPPRVLPFFAAESFVEYSAPKDVLSAAGFEQFYQTIRRFFLMYSEYFPAPASGPARLDLSMLATVGGKVFVGLWWVPLKDYQLPGDFFIKVNDRLERDFGVRAFWSTHDHWAAGDPDDLNYLFNGMAPLQRGKHPVYLAVDLLVGFWPPNLVNYKRDYFVPRAGGATYSAGWDALAALTPKPDIVLVESYNEITEGSHLMPSWPVGHTPGDGHWTGDPDDPRCAQQPCHPVEYTDTWGSSNPWHYLDLTRRRIDEWLRTAPPGSDRVAPHAWLRSPRDGDVVSDAIRLSVVAAAVKALREVGLYLDGDLVYRATSSFERLLKTWALPNGVHRVRVESVDQAGNRDSDVADIIVVNPSGGAASRIGAAVGQAGSGGALDTSDCTRFEPVAAGSDSGSAPLVTLRAVRVPCLVRD